MFGWERCQYGERPDNVFASKFKVSFWCQASSCLSTGERERKPQHSRNFFKSGIPVYCLAYNSNGGCVGREQWRSHKSKSDGIINIIRDIERLWGIGCFGCIKAKWQYFYWHWCHFGECNNSCLSAGGEKLINSVILLHINTTK